MSQRPGLADFNAKVSVVRAERIESNHFPDFAAQERAALQELQRRHKQAAEKNEAEVSKSHVPKTAADYRGPGAQPLPHKVKNEADCAAQLSVPLGNNAVHAKHGGSKTSFGKKTCDVAVCETNIRVTGGGSLFDKAKVSTYRGWKPGAM